MGALHRLRSAKIGDRARHAQHTMITPRSKAHTARSVGEQFRAPSIGCGNAVQCSSASASALVLMPQPSYRVRWISRARPTRVATSLLPSAGGGECQIGSRDPCNLDMEVDAIE